MTTADYGATWTHITFFATNGADLAWELITFGTNAKFTSEGNVEITQ